jgi:hypothetical protein
MKSTPKGRPLTGGMELSDVNHQLRNVKLDTEDRNKQKFAEEIERQAENAAATCSAWAAFTAWCEADDSKYRTWVETHRLLVCTSISFPAGASPIREDVLPDVVVT